MDLAQKIKLLRSEKGWTQDDLAKKSGVSVQSIKRYEAGVGENITTLNLQKFARVFDVQTSYFLGDDSLLSTNTQITATSENESDVVLIPYFEDTYASAGIGSINYDEVPNNIKFFKSFLRSFLGITGDLSNLHVISACGDSMEPTITNGELLFVRALQGDLNIVSGQVYTVNYDGDTFVKRLERNPVTKAITLFSDNDKYEPIVIKGQNLKNCIVVGRVVAHIRKGII